MSYINQNDVVKTCSEYLPNGLLVLSEAIPGVESVTIGVWADAGAADELGPGMHGLAHLLEHMLFKGTRTRTALEQAEAIEDVGGILNAYTDRETTHLFGRVLAGDLPVAVNLLGDMVCASSFPAEELERERQVVVEEIRKLAAQPEDRVHDLMMSGLYAGGALGHAVQGTEESIATLTREALEECRRRTFATGRTIIAAAGKLEHTQLMDLVGQAFAEIPSGGEPASGLPCALGEQQARVTGVQEDLEQVHFAWGGRTFPAADERGYALAYLDATLGAGTTSRLFQEVREKRGLAYDVSSYLMGFRHTGYICATGATNAETFDEALEIIRREIEALRRDGITAREFARAREQVKVGLALSLESTADRMRNLAEHQLTWGRLFTPAELLERIDCVTRDEVAEVAEQVLDVEQWTLATIGAEES